MVGVPLLVKLTGCSGNDGEILDTGGSGGGPEPAFRVSNLKTDDHQHEFIIVCADANVQQTTYTATGSGHVHLITLTGEQISTIINGGTVSFETNDSHLHHWELTLPANGCDGPADPPTAITDGGGGW